MDQNKKRNQNIAIVVAVIIVLTVAFYGLDVFRKIQPAPTTTAEINNEQNTKLKQMININDSLQYEDVVVGTGAEATSGKTISVNYTGKFMDGKIFDTSIGRAPFEFNLGAGQVIKGWDLGVAGMKVGGKRNLVIAPEMGYGARDVGPIPANSTLVFEVELLGVK